MIINYLIGVAASTATLLFMLLILAPGFQALFELPAELFLALGMIALAGGLPFAAFGRRK